MLYGTEFTEKKRKIREPELITREESSSHIKKKMTSRQVFVTEVSEGIISSKAQNLPGEKKTQEIDRILMRQKISKKLEPRAQEMWYIFCLLFQNVL